MDNFKTRKTPSSRSSNIDGFVGVSSGHSSRKSSAAKPSQIGNFKRSDGFHAAERGSVGTGTKAAAVSASTVATGIGRQPNRAPDGRINLTMPGEVPPKAKGRKARKARRKAKKANWSPRKRFLMRAGKLSLIIIVLISMFLGYKFVRNTSKVFQGNVFGLFQEDKLKGEDKGRVTILLAGNSTDDPGHSGSSLTDSIMLVSIDTVHNTGYMLSIPRDLWVPMGVNCSVGNYEKINAIYECGEEAKFNEAGYAPGGMGLLEKTVHENFGVDINYYALINYTAFKDAVNAVGGIDVTIKSDDPRGLYDANIAKVDGGPLKLPNGPVHLNGQTALNLARARGDTISYGFSRSDYTRTEHQRQMLLALKDKSLSVGVLSNPAKISSLFDAAGNNVKTDFKTSEIRRLYSIGKLINNNNIQSIGLADENVNLVQSFTSPKNTSAVRPVAGVYDFSQIKAYIKKISSNDPVAKEGATVVVLNGSGIDGLASKNALALGDKGIVVKTTGTATKPRATTTIVSLNNNTKTATKAYLEQKYKTTATTDVTTNLEAKYYTADFVIILGQNESTSH